MIRIENPPWVAEGTNCFLVWNEEGKSGVIYLNAEDVAPLIELLLQVQEEKVKESNKPPKRF